MKLASIVKHIVICKGESCSLILKQAMRKIKNFVRHALEKSVYLFTSESNYTVPHGHILRSMHFYILYVFNDICVFLYLGFFKCDTIM